jgi:hypothetical protein
MSSALYSLNQIPGVIGSALFNQNDECVMHMLPPPYDAMLLGNVMAELRNALTVLAYLDEQATWSGLVARFDGGYLVIRQVQRLTVMVLAHPTLNPAMLSVGFNVAALKLEREGLPPAPLPPPPLPPTVLPRSSSFAGGGAGGGAGAPSAAHPMSAMGPMNGMNMMPSVTSTQPGYPPPPLPPLTPPSGIPSSSISSAMSSQPIPLAGAGQSSRDFSISQSGGIPGIAPVSQSNPRLASASVGGFRADSQDTNVSPPVGVSKHIMDGLLKALARHIGPFAKLIMKEELHKLGATSTTLSFSQYEDFVSLLSRRVQDPAKRREFITEAESLPGKR